MSGALVYERVTEQDIEVGTGEVEITSPAGGKMRARRVNIASLAFATVSQAWTPGTVDPNVNPFRSLTIAIVGVVAGDMVVASWSGLADSRVLFTATAGADAVVVALTGTNNVTHNPGTGTVRLAVFKTNL